MGWPEKLKRSFGYNKFTEMLLRSNLEGVNEAALLTDRLTRRDEDNFREYLWAMFGPSPRYGSEKYGSETPVLRHIQEVDTALPQYQVGQICDILLGCILSDLHPPVNRNKLAVGEQLRELLGVPSFLPGYWRCFDKAGAGPATS